MSILAASGKIIQGSLDEILRCKKQNKNIQHSIHIAVLGDFPSLWGKCHESSHSEVWDWRQI